MMTLRRATERRHVQHGKHDIWHTFHQQEQPGLLGDAFGLLAVFNEIRLPPGRGDMLDSRDEAEIITYVYKGALAQMDSTGRSCVIRTGEFQCSTVGRGLYHKETNASRTDWAHVFRISLRLSGAGFDCANEQKRFAAAQRRNTLCVVASPDGRRGSLHVHQDAFVYSSLLDPGHHLVHELLPDRSTWFQVLHGEIALNNIVLSQGDGAGVREEPSVSFTAQESTEVLLVDLGPTPKRDRFMRAQHVRDTRTGDLVFGGNADGGQRNLTLIRQG